MRPRKPGPTPQSDMFRESVVAILDPRQELLRPAARIDWDRFDALYGATFVEHLGRPGLATRLMVGLHLLKHIKGHRKVIDRLAQSGLNGSAVTLR